MAYTCQKCGTSAASAYKLCNPAKEEFQSKFCGTSSDQVCTEKLASMKYSCEDCGSLSADAEHLCSPSQIR